ncbi:CBS domain-containing protein [Desulfococcaceae bacterium HSG9]|nr:CBS domain-containing protein [Desulfococcaceae bacterium HSG9]
MKVKDLFDKEKHAATTISPEATVYDALRLMAEKEIGAIVVLEEDKMVGIFSERDYARKVILKGKNSKDTLVREIMTADVSHASFDQKLNKCLSLMTKKRFRHMPVLENGRLMGILSIEDMRSMV